MVGKPEGKRQVGRPRRRWEENGRLNLTETGREGVVWIHVPQDADQWQALVNTVMNFRIP